VPNLTFQDLGKGSILDDLSSKKTLRSSGMTIVSSYANAGAITKFKPSGNNTMITFLNTPG